MTHNKNKSNDMTTKGTPGKTGISYKIVREVKSEVFKMEDNVEYLFKITGPIRIGVANTGAAALKREKRPDTVSVRDLENNKDGVIILGAALLSQFQEGYTDDGYVGRSFSIKCLGKLTGNRYKSYVVNEIEVEA